MEVLSNRSRKALSVSALLSGAFLAGCGGGGGGGAEQAGIPGTEVTKPGSTETFFVKESLAVGSLIGTLRYR